MQIFNIINALEQNIKNGENIEYSYNQLVEWYSIIEENPNLNILNWKV